MQEAIIIVATHHIFCRLRPLRSEGERLVDRASWQSQRLDRTPLLSGTRLWSLQSA